MKFDIYGAIRSGIAPRSGGDYVGTAEWRGPGQVVLQMSDPAKRSWFETYFAAEESFLGGPVDEPQMLSARRDANEEAFAHAAFALSAYAYKVQDEAGSGSGGG